MHFYLHAVLDLWWAIMCQNKFAWLFSLCRLQIPNFIKSILQRCHVMWFGRITYSKWLNVLLKSSGKSKRTTIVRKQFFMTLQCRIPQDIFFGDRSQNMTPLVNVLGDEICGQKALSDPVHEICILHSANAWNSPWYEDLCIGRSVKYTLQNLFLSH